MASEQGSHWFDESPTICHLYVTSFHMTRLLYLIMGGSRNKPLGVSRESPELLNEIIYDHTHNNIVNE